VGSVGVDASRLAFFGGSWGIYDMGSTNASLASMAGTAHASAVGINPVVSSSSVTPLPFQNSAFPPTPLGLPVQTLVKRALFLDNMVMAKELIDEASMKEFKEDVEEECAKCGIIKALAVPQPPADAVLTNQSGRIYVQFQEEFSARAVCACIDSFLSFISQT